MTYLPGQGSQQPHTQTAKPRHEATVRDKGTLARWEPWLAARAEPPLSMRHLWSWWLR